MARTQRKPASSNVVPLRLVADSAGAPDRETIDCLLQLLFAAQRGEVKGLAYVAMHEGRRYTIHKCGLANKSPTFTIGAVSVLLDDLVDRMRGGS